MMATHEEIIAAMDGLTDAAVIIGFVDEEAAVVIHSSRMEIVPSDYVVSQAWRTKDGAP